MSKDKDKGKRNSKEEREELLQLFGESGDSASRFCKEMGLRPKPKGFAALDLLAPDAEPSMTFLSIVSRLSLGLP